MNRLILHQRPDTMPRGAPLYAIETRASTRTRSCKHRTGSSSFLVSETRDASSFKLPRRLLDHRRLNINRAITLDRRDRPPNGLDLCFGICGSLGGTYNASSGFISRARSIRGNTSASFEPFNERSSSLLKPDFTLQRNLFFAVSRIRRLGAV